MRFVSWRKNGAQGLALKRGSDLVNVEGLDLKTVLAAGKEGLDRAAKLAFGKQPRDSVEEQRRHLRFRHQHRVVPALGRDMQVTTQCLAEELEAALRGMWSRWCARSA